MYVSLDTEHLKHISWCLRYSEFQCSLCEHVWPKDGHDMVLGLLKNLLIKIAHADNALFLDDIA